MSEKEEFQFPENHDCANCKLHRVIIKPAVPVEQDDCDVFDRIVTMVNNTNQLVKTPAPKEFSDEDRKAFFSAAISKNNDAKALLSEWWVIAQKKYGVPTSSKFDSFNGIFYHCVNNEGVPSLMGEFVPTEEYVKKCQEEDQCSDGCCCCK